MANEVVLFFAKMIEKELGIIYSDFNYFQLANRLEEIVKMQGFKDVEELYKIAQTPMTSTLKQLILDIATNNETSFFRDPKLFQAVKNQLIPELFNNAKNGSIKIWSAASSAGQEPYSIAMLLKEYSETAPKKVDYKILASDISSRILEKAQKAQYSQLEVQRGLSAAQLVKYFTKDNENYWTLGKEIRSIVDFKRVNLLDSFSQLGTFDVIFCRNVLIYQNVENKMMIINKLVSCLNENGYLILGAGESMIGLSDSFESVKLGEAIVYKLKPLAQRVKAA